MKRRLLYLLVLLMAMVTGMRAQAPSLSTPLTIEATTEGTIIVTDPKEGMKYSLNDGVKNTMSGNIEINVAAGDHQNVIIHLCHPAFPGLKPLSSGQSR